MYMKVNAHVCVCGIQSIRDQGSMKMKVGQAFVAIAGQLAPYGLAMLLLGIGVVIMNYFLAIGTRPFVLIILLACALQVGLIVWYHADIAQLVQPMMVTNASLVLALFIALGLKAWKTSVGIHYASSPGHA
jgi:hypothetical protein